jgi:hypothetical protein
MLNVNGLNALIKEQQTELENKIQPYVAHNNLVSLKKQTNKQTNKKHWLRVKEGKRFSKQINPISNQG